MPSHSACGSRSLPVARRISAVYISTMNCRPARRHALKTVTIRSMFWPEHQTSGIPGVCWKMSANWGTRSSSVGKVLVVPPDAGSLHEQDVHVLRRVGDQPVRQARLSCPWPGSRRCRRAVCPRPRPGRRSVVGRMIHQERRDRERPQDDGRAVHQMLHVLQLQASRGEQGGGGKDGLGGFADQERRFFREPVGEAVVVLVRVRDHHAEQRVVGGIESLDRMEWDLSGSGASRGRPTSRTSRLPCDSISTQVPPISFVPRWMQTLMMLFYPDRLLALIVHETQFSTPPFSARLRHGT